MSNIKYDGSFKIFLNQLYYFLKKRVKRDISVKIMRMCFGPFDHLFIRYEFFIIGENKQSHHTMNDRFRVLAMQKLYEYNRKHNTYNALKGKVNEKRPGLEFKGLLLRKTHFVYRRRYGHLKKYLDSDYSPMFTIKNDEEWNLSYFGHYNNSLYGYYGIFGIYEKEGKPRLKNYHLKNLGFVKNKILKKK